MGWLDKFLRKVASEAPIEMTLLPLSTQSIPGVNLAAVPDECYIELYIESLRLHRARRFATTFNGVVYSFTGFSREGFPKAELASVSKPDKLADLDANSLDRVITISKQLVAPVPWRGGVLSLQLGLFSVKTGNLLSPVIDYVTSVSAAAGVGFVGVAKPFLPLITQGIDMIAGQSDDSTIEVAIDTDLQLSMSGAWALVAASKGEIAANDLTLDDNDHKLLLRGTPLNRGYCVFSIRVTPQKPDFGEIPELKDKYGLVQEAIRQNKFQDAKDALTVFRLATIASPDLIPTDARRLVSKVEARVKEAFQAGGVSRAIAETAVAPLSEIDLYG
jgi:hypothetical protein